MNISFNKQENQEAVLSISIQEADYMPLVDKKAKELAKTAHLKGFRPGKVPANHLKRIYGPSLASEVVEQLIGDTLDSYLKEQKIEILGQPLMSKNSEFFEYGKVGDTTIVFDLGLAPALETPDFSAISSKRYKVEPSDAKLQEVIDDMLERSAKLTPAEISAKGGDISGQLTQVGGSYSEKTLVPLNKVQESELAAFLGKKVGDTISFDIRKAFQESDIRHVTGLSKEEADALTGTFELVVESINSKEKSELNAEFFEKVLGEPTETEEEFKAKLKERITQHYDGASEQRAFAEAKENILANYAHLSFPDGFLKRWLLMVNNTEKTEEKAPITAEQIEESYPLFIKDTIWELIRAKVSAADNIKINESDIIGNTVNMFEYQLAQMGIPSFDKDRLFDMAKNYLTAENGKNYRKAFQDTYSAVVDEAIFKKITFVEETISSEKFDA